MTFRSIEMIEVVAEGLSRLRERVVFVGGTCAALYVTRKQQMSRDQR